MTAFENDSFQTTSSDQFFPSKKKILFKDYSFFLNSLEKYSILKIEWVSDIVGWITKARLLIGLLKCSVLQFITATQVLLIDDSFWLNGWSLNIEWLNWKWQMLQMKTDTVKTGGRNTMLHGPCRVLQFKLLKNLTFYLSDSTLFHPIFTVIASFLSHDSDRFWSSAGYFVNKCDQ